jgi:hypothetical protein
VYKRAYLIHDLCVCRLTLITDGDRFATVGTIVPLLQESGCMVRDEHSDVYRTKAPTGALMATTC